MSRLDRPGRDTVTVYLEEEFTDPDGNLMTRASTTGITTSATVQISQASGTSARRAEQDNEGFETEETYKVRFPRSFPHILGAQSKIEWQGRLYSVFGDVQRYNGSDRTAHSWYAVRRT